MTNIGKSMTGVALAAAIACAASGCDQRRPAETAGQKIDRAAASAGQAIDRAGSDAAREARAAATEAARVLDDTAVTARVKAALFAEPGLKTLQLDVETHEGIVTLAGAVDTPVLKQRAVEIAGSLSGVRQVVDSLVVKS